MHGSFNVPTLSFKSAEVNDDRRKYALAQAEEALARAANAIVQRYYPGHPWRIEADLRGGVVKIQLQPWMGPTNWMIIHGRSTKNLFEFEQKVRRFCGEILERYQVPRTNFSEDHWRAAAQLVPSHRKFHGFLPA